jgi:Xaa-Pro aminopeptidase
MSTTLDERNAHEGVGPDFELQMMLEARKRTWRAIQDIAERVRPGMLEEDAVEMAREVLRDSGLLRGWHGLQLRFGENTLKPFGAPSEPGLVLQTDDIFFIDIGPVWRNWEGDGGQTFVVGCDPEMHRIVRDVRELFDRVQAKWRADGLTGEALYAFADREACSMGWRLNLDMAGHRLSDFPHSAFHKGPLAGARYTPSPNLWVLEIQIRHPERAFSAFYEDLLLEPQPTAGDNP